LPLTEPTSLTPSICSESLKAASLLTTTFFPSTSTKAYSTSGLTQTLVAP
jgi:hypothetical protein